MAASRGIMTAAAVVIVVAGMKAAAAIVIPFLLAAFIAIICSPILSGLRRKGVPTWAALVIIIVGVVVVVIARCLFRICFLFADARATGNKQKDKKD